MSSAAPKAGQKCSKLTEVEKSSGLRRGLGVAAALYAASVIGAALPVFGWDVCTQYDMGLFAPLFAPLLWLFGAFVIFALAFSSAAGGSLAAVFVLVFGAVVLVATFAIGLAALRSEHRTLWAGGLLCIIAALNAVTAAAFCVAASA